MNLDKYIEAILFLKGEPVTFRYLSKLLDKRESEIQESVSVLKERLGDGGLCVVEKDGSIMLATSPGLSDFTQKLTEEEFDSKLSKAGLETLSIILYRSPVSRADIDYIRGVNSAFIVRNLLVRGLIERVSNPRDNRSYLYKPSFQLLRYLGIKNIQELPEFGDFNEKIENFNKQFVEEKNKDEHTDESR